MSPRLHTRPACTPTDVPREDRVLAARVLNDLAGFGCDTDARSIMDRVAALAHAGETATSIMRRLNP